MQYQVIYFNGRGERNKYFPTIEEATTFKANCTDPQATIWQRV